MVSLPQDNQQRLRALDPVRSFIVQAPAGSGKTGLLVRRFLTLLANVDAPEEIVAITFTRKATAEMRDRILGAIQAACKPGESKTEIGTLAAKALKNDRQLGWDLVENPNRLRIQTIDAFAYELVRRMPWSARFGAAPEIIDDISAQHLYRQAAMGALDHISQQDKWSRYCASLIKLADAQLNKSRALLAAMLVKRDRWMRGLQIQCRDDFEQMWQQLIEQQLVAAHNAIPRDLKTEISFLAKFAASNPYQRRPNEILAGCIEMAQFPVADSKFLEQWRGIAALLLTKSGTEYVLRKPRGINVQHGFPKENDLEKKHIKSLLEVLTKYPKIVQTLSAIPNLPNPKFGERQWQNLESLLGVLPLAAAELRILFKNANQADYVEITQRAEMALGDVDSPSELALSADHQIKHILMDEIQDTSRAQIDLLTKLIREWQPVDGRTLFFVGDPMQSIYRFREAEVGNFLEIKKNGIGNIKPESLALESNFRSSQELITWFNQVFSEVFPADDDLITSAIRYSPVTAGKKSASAGIVSLHPQMAHPDPGKSILHEAESVVDQIVAELAENPDVDIGVLGRSRSHLIEIAQLLRQNQIDYQAIELESLAQRPPIRDLMSLTRALVQPADRIAWMALLRAPWCGLDLIDLSRLAMGNHSRTILELAEDVSVTHQLSNPGRTRLERFLAALEIPLSQRGRVSLRQNVYTAWINLGGSACIHQSDNQDCEHYFELLDTLENRVMQKGGQLITPGILFETVSRHWSQTHSTAQVQLLTIHKAKGLEFDVVIVPRLNSRSRSDDRDLLRWTRLPDQLLIAVLPQSDNREDKFYEYLGQLEKQRQRNELCRLLYVACTRARQKLHLFANLALESKDELKNPESNSLLGLVWPVLKTQFIDQLPASKRVNDEETDLLPLIQFRRLPLEWKGVSPPVDLKPDDSTKPGSTAHRGKNEDRIEFSWAGETARITGIAIHQMLQNIDPASWSKWKELNTSVLVEKSEYFLRYHGLGEEYLSQGLSNITTAIENIKTDSRADWIFSHHHREIQAEWPLTGVIDNTFTSIIIDRSFIDDTGTRWIVDFKSSRHENIDINPFLDNEQRRYQQQMDRYAQVMAQFENNKIKLGLYFPMLKGWREWSPA